MKITFQEWHKNHGCDEKQLWLIQNCLGDLLGWEHPDSKAAADAWMKQRYLNDQPTE